MNGIFIAMHIIQVTWEVREFRLERNSEATGTRAQMCPFLCPMITWVMYSQICG